MSWRVGGGFACGGCVRGAACRGRSRDCVRPRSVRQIRLLDRPCPPAPPGLTLSGGSATPQGRGSVRRRGGRLPSLPFAASCRRRATASDVGARGVAELRPDPPRDAHPTAEGASRPFLHPSCGDPGPTIDLAQQSTQAADERADASCHASAWPMTRLGTRIASLSTLGRRGWKRGSRPWRLTRDDFQVVSLVDHQDW